MKIKAFVLIAIAAASLSACDKSSEQLKKEVEEAQIRHDILEKTAAEKQSAQDYRESLTRPGVLQNSAMSLEDVKKAQADMLKIQKESDAKRAALPH